MTIDEERYLRNRSREAIADMFRVIRHLQQINKFDDSQVIRAMISVWRNTEDTTSFLMIYLFWMVKELEKDERLKRARLRREEKIRRETE
jgi:hypothetical protein